MATVEKKTILSLSMSIRCWDELIAYGAHEILRREYGQYLSATVEPNYNVTLNIDVEKFPPKGGMSSDHGIGVQFTY